MMQISYESFIPSSRSTASKLPQESPKHTTPPTVTEISWSTWMSSLCLVGLIHIKKPEVSCWGYEIFLEHLTLHLLRNKIIKVNITRSARFSCVEELATSQITSLFLQYTLAIMWLYSHKVRWAEVTSTLYRNLYWWTRNDVERRQKNEVSGPSSEKLARAEPLWCHMTEKQ